MVSSQDRVDLMKLAKALALKSTQIIIQSRNGNKVYTKCSQSSSGPIAFSLAIKDMLDVDKEAKRTMSAIYGDRWSLCTEIFLKTVDGDTMILESWNISLIPARTDDAKLSTMYGRLGILLKSVVAISRVIPAYRYSRKQTPDSWTIGHHMYLGEPNYNTLGMYFLAHYSIEYQENTLVYENGKRVQNTLAALHIVRF